MWEILADGRRWSEWGPWTEVELEREGSPPPDGTGAVRRLTAERKLLGRPVVLREEVTTFDSPATFGYRMLSGLPVRDYEATVSLSPAGEGTEIHWRAEFDPRIPGSGGLFRRGVSETLADVATRAAAAADRRAG